MLAIDEQTITEAALDQMSSTPNPRLKEIMAALVKHLHAFAREVDLTPEEWLDGIKFLTAVGQKCTEFRQEFIAPSATPPSRSGSPMKKAGTTCRKTIPPKWTSAAASTPMPMDGSTSAPSRPPAI